MNVSLRNAIESLQRNGFTVNCFETSLEAKQALLTDISVEETVGMGGSMTLINMGIIEELQSRGNSVFYHGLAKSPEEKKYMYENAGKADIYLSSSNAITEDGRLVNVDGTGNRLANMLYGHKRLYIVAGINKITKNIDEAMVRIKNVAAPQNTKRLNSNTPCSHEGKCSNCSSPKRICNATLIMDRQMLGANTIVYLINEKLGY